MKYSNSAIEVTIEKRKKAVREERPKKHKPKHSINKPHVPGNAIFIANQNYTLYLNSEFVAVA